MTNAYFQDPNELISEFNEIIEQAEQKAIFTVGIELQKSEISKLNDYQKDLNKRKEIFAKKNQENDSNLIYCFSALVKVIQLELEMLVALKEDKMADAWDFLVDAEVILGNVIRNYPFETDHLYLQLNKFKNYEDLLFPKMTFHSAGSIVKESHCSICEEDYGKCDHIKGKLYNGELCCRIITEQELEEISLVKNPANKHCRTLYVEYDNKKIDLLTYREV